MGVKHYSVFRSKKRNYFGQIFEPNSRLLVIFVPPTVYLSPKYYKLQTYMTILVFLVLKETLSIGAIAYLKIANFSRKLLNFSNSFILLSISGPKKSFFITCWNKNCFFYSGLIKYLCKKSCF
jgi:hypothetical protein